MALNNLVHVSLVHQEGLEMSKIGLVNARFTSKCCVFYVLDVRIRVRFFEMAPLNNTISNVKNVVDVYRTGMALECWIISHESRYLLNWRPTN